MARALTMSITTRWIDIGAQLLSGATALFVVCIALTGGDPRDAGHDDRLRSALAAYEAQQWPQAYAQLAAAADAGDPDAARLALMMARQGPLLFGRRFDVGGAQRARWEFAAAGRRPVQAFTSRETGARTGGSPPAVQVAGAR